MTDDFEEKVSTLEIDEERAAGEPVRSGEMGVADPSPPPANPKIAIFGTTPSRMESDLHLDGSGWQRWTIGPGGMDSHGWERLYEIHGQWPESFKEYLDTLSKYEPPKQVVMLWDLEPRLWDWRMEHGYQDEEKFRAAITGEWKAVRIAETERLYNKYGRVWFSSSISYAMAEAIEENPEVIALYGIDLESGEEYISQYIGCRYFIDLARLAGIDVRLPAGSGLQRDPIPYPDRYETHIALNLERKKAFLEAQRAGYQEQHEGARCALLHQEGAQAVLAELRPSPNASDAAKQTWQAKWDAAEETRVRATKALGELAARVNHLNGSIEMCDYYRRMFVMSLHDPI